MTVRKLHLLGSPVLRQRAAPVAAVDDAVRELVDDLWETMRAAKGVGLAAIHWGTGAEKNQGEAWLNALGGWFNADLFSKYLVRTTRLRQADPKHPICFGWEEFDLREEYYIELKFLPDAKPILKATINEKDYPVAWVYDRPDGGRSFGFLGGHFHDNYATKPFRRAIVNGILWTAHVEVPPQGAPVDITAQDMELPPDQRKKK